VINRLVIFLILVSAVLADEPVVPVPIPTPPPSIVFPDTVPVNPDVDPNPNPPAPTEVIPIITQETWYVVTSDFEFFLLCSPAKLAEVQYEEGPIKLKGVFTDSKGKVETRTYKSRYVALVNANKWSGRAELIAIPAGIVGADAITRRLVDIGAAPQPPPNPPKPIDPKPIDPLPVPTGFRVLFIYESMDAVTPAVDTILNSVKIRNYLKAKCTKSADGVAEYRFWDKDITVSQNESPTIKSLWESVKPTIGSDVPRLVVAVNGDAKVYPLPPTEAATLEFLKSIGGE